MTSVRRLPKRTKIYFLIIVILGIIYYLFSSGLKDEVVKQGLEKLGHKNISKLIVYGSKSVVDKISDRKGSLYTVKFLQGSEECRGNMLIKHDGKLEDFVKCGK